MKISNEQYKIGNTPLKLVDFLSNKDIKIWAKLEYFNPTGSHKDRAYLSIINDLERKNKIKKGMILVDYTSGNAGAALARLAKIKGYRSLIFVPSQMSIDKIRQIESYGAKVKKIFSNAKYGYYGPEDVMRARLEAARIVNENPKKYIFLDQGENPANKLAFEKLGKEIINDMEKRHIIPDAFVAAIGTGGTISGVSKVLKQKYGNKIKIIGVEPYESPTIYSKIHKQKAFHLEHNLSGVGIGAREANIDLDLIDDVILVKQSEWLKMLYEANGKGYPIGKSSAADLVAVKKAIKKFPGLKNIVTIFFDRIEKYESEKLISKKIINKKIYDFYNIEKKYKNSWDELFSNKLFHLRTEKDPKLDVISSIIKKKPKAKILSIACGDFINELYLCQKGFRVYGIDVSNIAISKAKNLIKKNKIQGCSVIKGDIFKKKISKLYDAIIIFDFSMHLTDITLINLLNKAANLLKPDGLLFINFLSPKDDTFNFGDVVGPKIRSVRNGKILIHYRDLFEIEEIISASPFSIKRVENYKRIDKTHYGFRNENKQIHTHRGYFLIAKKELSTVSDALKDAKSGRPIIIIDHREQEGDFFIPSKKVTPQVINDFLKYGRGVLCVSLLPQRFRELGLGSPSIWGTGYNETRFGDPVDYLIGITTGVSAFDRANTIKGIIAKSTSKSDIRVPGHVRTLESVPGGLNERSGHTEASIELSKLAGFYPSGTIIEILNDDGTMAREPEIIKLAKRLKYKVIRINQIKYYICGKI